MSTDNGDRSSRFAGAAGRAAAIPRRAAVRAWRDGMDGVVEATLASPELTRAIDRALEGPLPEHVVQSAIRAHVGDRVAAELIRSGEIDRLIDGILASPRTEEVARRLLADPEIRRSVASLISSEQVGDALAAQTSGVANDVIRDVRSAARSGDGAVSRGAARTGYGNAGLISRGLAAGIDLVLLMVACTSVVGIGALVGSLVGGFRPAWLVSAILAVGWTLVTGGYFVGCWSLAGQTLGMRLVSIRVAGPDGARPSVARSVGRYVATLICVLPLLAGYLPVLFEDRRRAVSDMLSGTTVAYSTDAAEPGRGRG
jgi:uncharacterized RDD family membrane protein YckC